MSTPFAHDAAGTPATTWHDDPRWAGAAAPVPHPLDAERLVVVAAHPDDETLGAGGVAALAHRAGLEVHLVLLTAGEHSHPRSPTHGPADLAARRLEESSRALAEVAPGATMTFLGLDDGAVAVGEHEAATGIVGVVGDGRRTVVLAPWRHDGHPDHEAAGRAAATAAARTGAGLLEYPVWLWHWGTPSQAPWGDLRAVDLDADARAAKARAVAAHATQVQPLSPAPGDETLLGADLLAHFAGPREVFVQAPAADVVDTALDDLHAGLDDPWGVDTRWYERRKRDLVLALLPRRRFARAIEVGCSTGALAAALAARCDALLAADSSPTAVRRAGVRLADVAHVDVERLDLPREWPEGSFDLVVVSEVGYFLSPAALDDLLDAVTASLTDDAVVVLCHWRHPVVGWVLDGPQVHRRAVERLDRPVAATYRDRDVEILVLCADAQLPVPSASDD